MNLYGIAEIAGALGIDRHLVAQWHRRSKAGSGGQGMPLPDAELAMGPVWSSKTIGPWIKKQKQRGQRSGR